MGNRQAKSRKWTKQEDDFVKENYIFRDRNSIDKIASVLGRSRKAILHRITLLGVTNIKSEKFDNATMSVKVPTVDTAYILGMYLSDGWIEKDALCLSSIDKDYCEACLDSLDNILDGDFSHRILEREDTRKESYNDRYRIRVRSFDLCRWLIGVTDSKQSISKAFVESEKHILLSLLAGLMDGDGSIGISKRDRHVPSGYKIMLCGHTYIYGSVLQYASILDRIGIKYKARFYKSQAPGFLIYNLDRNDFLDNGCYFRITRKQNRLNTLKILRDNFNEHHGAS